MEISVFRCFLLYAQIILCQLLIILKDITRIYHYGSLNISEAGFYFNFGHFLEEGIDTNDVNIQSNKK